MIMSRRRPTRTVLIRIGWAGLLTAILVPVSASMLAIVLNQLYSRCADGIRWTFAPLAYSCGDPNWIELSVGWLGTLVTAAGPAGAIVVCVVALLYPTSEDGPGIRWAPGAHLGLTTMAVGVAVYFVLASDPDRRFGTQGIWILVTSVAALLTCIVAIVAGSVIRYWVSLRQG